MFYEVKEYYHYGSKRMRFVELNYDERLKKFDFETKGLPMTSGMSYKYCRDLMVKEFGDIMGLDALLSGDDELIKKAREEPKGI